MTARGRTRDEGSIERNEPPERVDGEQSWEVDYDVGIAGAEGEKGKKDRRGGSRDTGTQGKERGG